jgi:hypothetical protein
VPSTLPIVIVPEDPVPMAVKALPEPFIVVEPRTFIAVDTLLLPIEIVLALASPIWSVGVPAVEPLPLSIVTSPAVPDVVMFPDLIEIVPELALVAPPVAMFIVPPAAVSKLIAPAPLPPWIVVVWAAAPIEPIVTPTVPVAAPLAPMLTVLVVPDPGTPFAMLTTSPPDVVDVPLAMFTVCVAEVRLPEPMLMLLEPVVERPIVIVPLAEPLLPMVMELLLEVPIAIPAPPCACSDMAEAPLPPNIVV